MQYTGDWKAEFKRIAGSGNSELHFDLLDLTLSENLTLQEFSDILVNPVSNTQWEISTLYNEFPLKFAQTKFYLNSNAYTGREIFNNLH